MDEAVPIEQPPFKGLGSHVHVALLLFLGTNLDKNIVTSSIQ